MEQEFHVGVKAIFLNERGEILLLRKSPRHGSAGTYWDIPGGRVKQGSGIEDTLRREIREEIGARQFGITRLFDAVISNIIPHKGEKGLFLVAYLCALDPGSRIVLDTEHTEFKWAGVDEAKELLSFKFPASFLEKLDGLAP